MIVDDEAPARSELKFLLDELGQTEVVAEAASVREAIEFKVNAIDYLVKPVETERLSQAISRVREHVSLHVQAQKSERIPVEKGGKKILIGIDKIRFVMARDDYAYLQTDTDRYFSTVSLAQLEKRLDGHGFFRVHRGYLVNLSMVEEIESVSGGTPENRRPFSFWHERHQESGFSLLRPRVSDPVIPSGAAPPLCHPERAKRVEGSRAASAIKSSAIIARIFGSGIFCLCSRRQSQRCFT